MALHFVGKEVGESSGVMTEMYYDDSNGQIVFHELAEIGSHLRENKERQKYGPKCKDTQLVAAIPNSVYNELMRSGRAKDPESINDWLNRRENRKFKTTSEWL